MTRLGGKVPVFFEQPGFVSPGMPQESVSLARILHNVRVGKKGSLEAFKSWISAEAGMPCSFGKPTAAVIEIVTECNLHCPLCPAGKRDFPRAGLRMEWDLYRSILDTLSHPLNRLFLYFIGEPTLHPELARFISEASSRNIFVEIATNGEDLDAEALVDSGVHSISIQVAGIHDETHAFYRRGGNIRNVRHHIEALRHAADRKARSVRPTIEVGFLAMKHNESELDSFPEWAWQAGADRIGIYPCHVETYAECQMWLPSNLELWDYDPQLTAVRNRPTPRSISTCGLIYSCIHVLVDGTVVPCCKDTRGQVVLGDLKYQPVEEIWNGPRMKRLRESVSGPCRSELCRCCGGISMHDLVGLPRQDRDGER